LTQAPCPFIGTFLSRKILSIYINEKILKNATHIHLTAIAIDYHDGNSGYNSLLSRADGI
jgi:hypothetical protein